jgi:hypothetical protein
MREREIISLRDPIIFINDKFNESTCKQNFKKKLKRERKILSLKDPLFEQKTKTSMKSIDLNEL